nr:putative ATPase, F0 complex, subunit G [Tanacetum cinerariifolium]
MNTSMMASKLRQATESYTGMMAKNQQYIQEPATVEKCRVVQAVLLHSSCQPFVITQSSIPNRTESFWRELDFVKHSLKNFRTEMPIERVAALFGLECFLWFWAAEIAGRGFTVTGYDV